MYAAVITILLGQTLLLASPALLVYACVVAPAMVAFAHWYEEPTPLAHPSDDHE